MVRGLVGWRLVGRSAVARGTRGMVVVVMVVDVGVAAVAVARWGAVRTDLSMPGRAETF